MDSLTKFAKDNGLDVAALKELTEGVIARITHYGLTKFTMDTPEVQEMIIDTATKHFMESRAKIHDDLINNTDGSFDKLLSDVYDLIKGS